MECGLKGLVLAGGKSSRLGRDKVTVPVSGVSLLSRTAHLAKRFCGEVYVSGRDPGPMQVSFPWLADDVPGMGPMGGILTGLDKLGSTLLVLACDLPMLNETTLDRLLDAHLRRPPSAVMTTFRQVETGYIESLVAVYEPGAAPYLRQSGRSGLYKLSRAVPEAVRHHVDYSQAESSVFFNINYPADLALFQRVEAMQAANPDRSFL